MRLLRIMSAPVGITLTLMTLAFIAAEGWAYLQLRRNERERSK